MTNVCQNNYPVVTLTYEEGDLIVKEGDYGISIYKINKGKVLSYIHEGDMRVPLSTSGPGDIFGEIAFLNQTGERRSASVRALENTNVDVWHPALISQEYREMPPMLNYLAGQLLARLLRMNRLLVQLTEREQQRRRTLQKSDPFVSQRCFYRKAVDIDCHYHPVGLSAKGSLKGRIKDISLSGLAMEITIQNTANVSHITGDSFIVKTVLPNGKDVELEAKTVTLKQNEIPSRLLMGMSISRVSEDARKALGFFMMP